MMISDEKLDDLAEVYIEWAEVCPDCMPFHEWLIEQGYGMNGLVSMQPSKE